MLRIIGGIQWSGRGGGRAPNGNLADPHSCVPESAHDRRPRPSGRAPDQLREVRIERGYTRHAEGSVLVSFGDTRVLCTASVDNRVPGFLRGKGEGWVTAEYGMLPRATHTRNDREAARGKQGGRTLEIQRLIGRALRACVDRSALGERTITLDCDVLQADGGTRTAAITGAYVALVDAVRWLQAAPARSASDPIFGAVAAVSVGIYRGVPVLDLDYAEDSDCDTDMNVVMNDGGGFIELQGTAEGHAFRREELERPARRWPRRASRELLAAQREALGALSDGASREAGAGQRQRRQARGTARPARRQRLRACTRSPNSASPTPRKPARPSSRTRC